MNEHTDTPFIYITPFLREIERVNEACPLLKFVLGRDNRKVSDLRYALIRGDNIICTHQAFLYLTKDDTENIRKHGYEVIIDEVMNVIEILKTSPSDVKVILENFVEIDDENYITWKGDYSGSKFKSEMMLIKNKRIMTDNHYLMWIFPKEVMIAAKQTYILTYMFPFTIMRYYLDMMKIPYEIKTISNGKIVEHDGIYRADRISDLVNLYDGHYNEIGENTYALSNGWYGIVKDNKNYEKNRRLVKNAIRCVIRREWKAKGKEIYWTVFKEIEKNIVDNGYRKSFLSCNARATNEYRQCKYVVYAVNLYFNPPLKTVFNHAGINIDDKGWALSELIQFVMRSAVRDDKPIYLYIPSRRMREIWKSYVENGLEFKVCF